MMRACFLALAFGALAGISNTALATPPALNPNDVRPGYNVAPEPSTGGVVPAGTGQGSAAALNYTINIVNSCPTGFLQLVDGALPIQVVNNCTMPVQVLPGVGESIAVTGGATLSVNAPATVAAGSAMTFYLGGSGIWTAVPTVTSSGGAAAGNATTGAPGLVQLGSSFPAMSTPTLGALAADNTLAGLDASSATVGGQSLSAWLGSWPGQGIPATYATLASVANQINTGLATFTAAASNNLSAGMVTPSGGGSSVSIASLAASIEGGSSYVLPSGGANTLGGFETTAAFPAGGKIGAEATYDSLSGQAADSATVAGLPFSAWLGNASGAPTAPTQAADWSNINSVGTQQISTDQHVVSTVAAAMQKIGIDAQNTMTKGIVVPTNSAGQAEALTLLTQPGWIDPRQYSGATSGPKYYGDAISDDCEVVATAGSDTVQVLSTSSLPCFPINAQMVGRNFTFDGGGPIVSGFISSVPVSAGGSYAQGTAIPALSLTDPTGNGEGVVTGFVITNGGSGYSASTATVTISSSTGSQFIGTPIVSGGAITGVQINAPGMLYKAGDTVTFGGGSGATATLQVGVQAKLAMGVGGGQVLSGGSGCSGAAGSTQIFALTGAAFSFPVYFQATMLAGGSIATGSITPIPDPQLSNNVTVAASPTNHGTGSIGTVGITPATTAHGAFTLMVTGTGSAAAFSLTDPHGLALPGGNVGTPYAGGGLSFTLSNGGTNFVPGDGFSLTVNDPQTGTFEEDMPPSVRTFPLRMYSTPLQTTPNTCAIYPVVGSLTFFAEYISISNRGRNWSGSTTAALTGGTLAGGGSYATLAAPVISTATEPYQGTISAFDGTSTSGTTTTTTLTLASSSAPSTSVTSSTKTYLIIGDDDAPAIAASTAAMEANNAQGIPSVVFFPGGNTYLASAVPCADVGGYVGLNATASRIILDPVSFSGAAVCADNANIHNQNSWADTSAASTYKSHAGLIMRDFSVWGDRNAINPQFPTAFWGETEFGREFNINAYYTTGGYVFGMENPAGGDTAGDFAESFAGFLQGRWIGSDGYPAFQVGAEGSVGTNTTMFSTISLYNPRSVAIQETSNATGTGLADIWWSNIRIESGTKQFGPQSPNNFIEIGEPNEQNVNTVQLWSNLIFINPPEDYAAIKLACPAGALTGNNTPSTAAGQSAHDILFTDISNASTNSSGNGAGVDVQCGYNDTFDFNDSDPSYYASDFIIGANQFAVPQISEVLLSGDQSLSNNSQYVFAVDQSAQTSIATVPRDYGDPSSPANTAGGLAVVGPLNAQAGIIDSGCVGVMIFAGNKTPATCGAPTFSPQQQYYAVNSSSSTRAAFGVTSDAETTLTPASLPLSATAQTNYPVAGESTLTFGSAPPTLPAGSRLEIGALPTSYPVVSQSGDVVVVSGFSTAAAAGTMVVFDADAGSYPCVALYDDDGTLEGCGMEFNRGSGQATFVADPSIPTDLGTADGNPSWATSEGYLALQLANYVASSKLGASFGVATLDGTGHLTAAQLPTGVITTASVGVASGVAELNSSDQLVSSELPSAALTTSSTISPTQLAGGAIPSGSVITETTPGCSGSGLQLINQTYLATCGSAAGTVLPGYISGYQLTSVTNTTLTYGRGQAADSTGAAWVTSTASITINAAVVGANGLDTGSLGASHWYTAYAISGTSGTALILSLSTSGPALPSGYSYWVRIGAAETNASSQLLAMTQDGQTIWWGAEPTDMSAATPGTSGLTPVLSVPPGVKVRVLERSVLGGTASACDFESLDEAAAVAGFDEQTNAGNWPYVLTSTGQEIKVACLSSATTVTLYARGWVDPTLAAH